MVISHIPFAFPGLPRVRCVFTTRLAGNLALNGTAEEDRGKAFDARNVLRTELGLLGWTELRQVHGDVFLCNPAATRDDAFDVQEADGQATDMKNHALCVKTADCQPILLAHPKGCIAAIHAGWRGNVLEFPRTAVETFCSRYFLDPSEVRAVRGPSLGYAEFVNFDREWPKKFFPWYDPDNCCMDLWSLTRRQLIDAGLKERNIHGLDFCTWSCNSLFFSHRRGDAGRQMGIIWRE